MNISKTTINFAQKRGFDITVENFGEGDMLAVWELDNDCEWMFTYRMNEDGSFTWNGNVYLEQEVKEELPATIKNEKHLRLVIEFLAAAMK